MASLRHWLRSSLKEVHGRGPHNTGCNLPSPVGWPGVPFVGLCQGNLSRGSPKSLDMV